MTMTASDAGAALRLVRDGSGRPIPNGLTLLLGCPGVATPSALIIPSGLAFEEYASALVKLLAIHQGSGWWLGDLLRAFEGEHGQKYVAAIPLQRENRVSAKTCANAKWVCGKFEFSRRRENLSFGHHEAAAALEEEDEQDLWLDRAEREGWSVHRLREELQKIKKPQASEAPDLVTANPPAALISPLQSFMDADGEVREPNLPVRTSSPLPPVDRSEVDAALNAFLGDLGDDDADEEDGQQGEPIAGAAPSSRPAAQLPGIEVIPADTHIWTSIQKSRSRDIEEGYIERPILVNGKLWVALPVPIVEAAPMFRQAAVRVLDQDGYISAGFSASRPIMQAAVWRSQVSRSERAADDYTGLRVNYGGTWYVVMANRAVFTWRDPDGETAPSVIVPTQTPADDSDLEVLPAEIDRLFARAILDVDPHNGERFLANNDLGIVEHWAYTLTAMAEHIKALEATNILLDPDRQRKLDALCQRTAAPNASEYVGMLIDQRFGASGLTLEGTEV